MQSTRGAAFSGVSSAAHRRRGSCAPDSDPSVTFVQARAATASVSDEFIRATNTLVLALFYSTTTKTKTARKLETAKEKQGNPSRE